jgi:hypothetical protein
MKLSHILPGIVLAAGLQMAAPLWGLDFRVDTEIFVGTEKEPVAENLTIFSGGHVYDFLLNGSKEVTIYDPARGQFTLLDTERKLRSTISTQKLIEYQQSMEMEIAKGDDPFLKSIAKPAFETKIEEFEENGEERIRITLSSKEVAYRVVARRPPHPEAVPAFRQAGDYFARFNATRPGSLPPGARLVLNQALAERGLIPLEIERTIVTPGIGGKTLEVRSHHLFIWLISNQDRSKIAHAGACLTDAEFKSVEFEEQRSMPAAKTAAKGAPKKG